MSDANQQWANWPRPLCPKEVKQGPQEESTCGSLDRKCLSKASHLCHHWEVEEPLGYGAEKLG